MTIPEKSIFEKVKEAGSHTAIYGIGAALQSGINFLFIPLYTRYFTTEVYGVLSLIIICGTIGGSFFCLGTTSALARSFYDYEDADERKRVVSTSFYLALFGALLQISLGIVFGRTISGALFHTDKYAVHIILILVSTALSFLNGLFYVVLRFEKLSKKVVALNVVSLISTVTLVVYLLAVKKMGVMAPILGRLISEAVLFFMLLFLTRKNLVLDYSKHELRVQLSFGLQAVVMSMGFYSLDWINRYSINAYGSLSDVGIYSLGAQISLGISVLFVGPFSQIWAPMRMQYRNDRNADEFLSKMLTYFVMMGIIVAISISLLSKEVITLFAGHKEYIEAWRVVPFVVTGLLIYGLIGMVDYGLYLSRKIIYYAFILWSVCCISLFLNFIFVGRYGYMAAAPIILGCYSMVAWLVFHVSNRMYRIQFETKRLAWVGSIGGLALAAGYVLDSGQFVGAIFYKGAVISIVILLFFKYVLMDSERRRFENIVYGYLYRKNNDKRGMKHAGHIS